MLSLHWDAVSPGRSDFHFIKTFIAARGVLLLLGNTLHDVGHLCVCELGNIILVVVFKQSLIQGMGLQMPIKDLLHCMHRDFGPCGTKSSLYHPLIYKVVISIV